MQEEMLSKPAPHLSSEWFSKRVEAIVKSDRISYMEAIIDLCEMYEMEPALAAGLISKSIEQHVKDEAIELNMFKSKSESLPL
jgi:hypothetical protein